MDFFFPLSFLHREKKKEQERDELWKKLEELKLSNTTLVQNNSHGLPSVQNNNNNNSNNNNGNQDNCDDPPAITVGDKDPDVITAASESTPCAKWQQRTVLCSVTVWHLDEDSQVKLSGDLTQITPQQYIKST